MADRTTTKRTSEEDQPAKRTRKAPERNDGERRPARKKTSAMQVARLAAQQLAQLTGRSPETVIGIERGDDGWVVELEVVESRRIPDSTDVLATYRVETDDDGELMAYHRVRRYVRGKGGDDDGGVR
jgi:hypothetical protein